MFPVTYVVFPPTIYLYYIYSSAVDVYAEIYVITVHCSIVYRALGKLV
jgi:hypothetical protein